jgi:hypothetical protein
LNLVKTPISPKTIPALEQKLSAQVSRRYTAGGNIAWLAAADIEELDTSLAALELSGLLLFGPPGRPYLGRRQGVALAQRVKQALDPAAKFLDI